MKHLFTLSERLKGRGRGSVTSATSASAIFCKLVEMVKLFMPFMKATRRQSDTTFFADSLKSLMSIFAESAESAKSAKPIFANRGVKDVRVSLDQSPTNIQRISNLYLTPNRYLTRFAAVFALVFVMGVGNVWGVAFAPSNFSGQGTSGIGSAISATVDGVTFACDKGYGTTQIRCYDKGKITISSSSTITAISFTFSGSYKGGLETSYTNLSTTSWTKTLSGQARITACTVTVAATYSVLWTINPAGYGSLSATTGTTTTVTPGSAYTYGSPAYTVTSGTASVSQSTNTFTATPTANCTIRINMVEKPKYTITLKDDNSSLTQTTVGESVTLPSRTGCTGYTFAGWTKTWVAPQSSWTTTAPTIIPAGSYTPTANENLYPVYTKTEGGGTTPTNKSITFGTSYASNQSSLQSVTIYTGITATATNGTSTNPTYYTTSPGTWRIYKGSELTISSSIGKITSIVFTKSSDFDMSVKSGSLGTLSSTTWSYNDGANSVTFNVGGTTKLSAIQVTYLAPSSTTSYISVPNCTGSG